jgi:hypothetical protein
MNAEELFAVWAPEGSTWSPWVKPVLFAAQTPIPDPARAAWAAAKERVRGRWKPGSGREALLIDLAGPESLALALECAAYGYRPVPVINSCCGSAAFIDNEPTRAGLEEGAAILRGISLPSNAPPAFVLDGRRMTGVPKPADFDNRWLAFPQDFPSAVLLRSQGIPGAVLIQEQRRDPRDDLAHVLLRWQQGNVGILSLDLASMTEGPLPIEVSKPPWFRAAAYRVLATFRLRRNSAGGFGAIVPTFHGGMA